MRIHAVRSVIHNAPQTNPLPCVFCQNVRELQKYVISRPAQSMALRSFACRPDAGFKRCRAVAGIIRDECSTCTSHGPTVPERLTSNTRQISIFVKQLSPASTHRASRRTEEAITAHTSPWSRWCCMCSRTKESSTAATASGATTHSAMRVEQLVMVIPLYVCVCVCVCVCLFVGVRASQCDGDGLLVFLCLNATQRSFFARVVQLPISLTPVHIDEPNAVTMLSASDCVASTAWPKTQGLQQTPVHAMGHNDEYRCSLVGDMGYEPQSFLRMLYAICSWGFECCSSYSWKIFQPAFRVGLDDQSLPRRPYPTA